MRTHAVSPESLIAYDSSLPSHANDRDKILSLITSSFWGMTSKELAERLGKPLHAISGRLTELQTPAVIKKCGRRDGCAVWVSVEEPKLF